MGYVYPRAPETKAEVTPINAVICTALIIAAKDADTPKAEAIGTCLAGSDDVSGFERLWKMIDAQVLKARAVSPADHSTVTSYKSAVSAAAPLLDATKWYNGLKAECEVSTYGELTSKVEELAEAKEL